jgi:hypothetical protein
LKDGKQAFGEELIVSTDNSWKDWFVSLTEFLELIFVLLSIGWLEIVEDLLLNKIRLIAL